MTRAGRFSLVVFAVLALALVWAAASAAGGGVWVSNDGTTRTIDGGTMVLLGDDEGLDLSELADGETRVLGSGDTAVTVARTGNVATIRRAAVGDHEAIDVRCELDRDTCKVVTSADDPDRVTIVVRKERECTNGEGDCDQSVWLADAMGDAHRVIVRSTVHCDDEGECAEIAGTAAAPHVVRIETLAGAGSGGQAFVVDSGDGVKSEVIVVPRGDSVLLRCPEGDATLSVKKDEAEQVFLCPKHSVPLERVESRHGVRRVQRPDARSY